MPDRPPAPDPLAEHLLGYADARLAPDPRTLERLRASAVSAFVGAAAAGARHAVVAGARHAVVAGARQSGGARPRLRLGLAAVAGLVLAGAGIAAASGPGQPFYSVRLAVEQALTPPSGANHTQAVLAQLDQRLSELQASADAGDAHALADALAAYRAALRGLTADGTTALDGVVLSNLARHRTALSQILDIAPASATGGVQQAIDDAARVTTVIENRSGPGPAVPSVEPSSAATPPTHPAASNAPRP